MHSQDLSKPASIYRYIYSYIYSCINRQVTHSVHWLFYLCVLTLTSACSTLPAPAVNTSDKDLYCRGLFSEIIHTADKFSVTDSQTHRIPGFPYLHVNRLLVNLKLETQDELQVESWLDQAQALALQTYTIEYANLPQAEQQRLRNKIKPGAPSFINALTTCAQHLRAQDKLNPIQRNLAISKARVPDDYQTWQRLLGLYAITALPVVVGINNWHNESTEKFNQDYRKTPSQGQLIRYLPKDKQPLTRTQVAALINQYSNNPFAIPMFPRETLTSVFATYAPVFEIDTMSNSDRIGSPQWPRDNPTIDYPVVDISTITVFMHLSYAFLDDSVLPQLNYILWFPSRPCDSWLDILCGQLDGIMWRVTLDHEGRPIHYDSAHNCGCYHTFFPTPLLKKRSLAASFEEQAFTPVSAPIIKESEKIQIRIEARSHHIVSLSTFDPIALSEKPATTTVDHLFYQLSDYNQLRSLEVNNGQHRSLFQPDGLVAGTQRGERFILWPMGIPSPGSMRQWGHHATAFVGRRYFDDPCLLTYYYTRTDSNAEDPTNQGGQSHFACATTH